MGNVDNNDIISNYRIEKLELGERIDRGDRLFEFVERNIWWE